MVLGRTDLPADTIGFRRGQQRCEQLWETGVQIAAAQPDEAARAVLAGPCDARVTQHLQVVALSAAGLPDAVIDQIKAGEVARIPLGRRGDPTEVATWILRLADADAVWLTGQVLTVDGGLELT